MNDFKPGDRIRQKSDTLPAHLRRTATVYGTYGDVLFVDFEPGIYTSYADGWELDEECSDEKPNL